LNHNVGISSNGVIALINGVAPATPRSLKKWTRFGWVVEVHTAIATNAVFKVQFAPPSAANPCIPGVFVDALDVPICAVSPVVGALAEFTIPAGTAVGSNCAVTINCRANEFVRLVAVSGDTANVNAVLVRTGPTA